MGACASRPKDLDYDQVPGEAPAPVDAPVLKENEKTDTVPQEKKDGDEIKKEEPLLDLSEPAQEAPKTEEVAKPVEAKPATEEVVPAAKTEAKTEEAPKEEKKEVAEIVATPEKPAAAEVAAAPKTEGKNDAPVVKA